MTRAHALNKYVLFVSDPFPAAALLSDIGSGYNERINLKSAEISPDLRTLLRSCFAVLPFQRPTIRRFAEGLRRHLPQKALIDSLMNRLEGYATDLENEVSERTNELIQEIKRVDLLLGFMIPPLVPRNTD